jgi:hypothetical protein
VQPKAFDPSPNALTDAEITAVEEALSCGYTPRAKLIRKMLKLAKQSSTAYDAGLQQGIDWASGKVVTKP